MSFLERALERFSDWWRDYRGARWGQTIGEGSPYLQRYYLAGSRNGWGLFLHQFCRSDQRSDGLHDHPWPWGVSLVLVAGYREVRLTSDPIWGALPRKTVQRAVMPFRLNILLGNTFHRVHLFPRADGGERAAWTLLLHGPRTKAWGFLDEDTGIFRKYVYVEKERNQF